jgi:hypothetical protein
MFKPTARSAKSQRVIRTVGRNHAIVECCHCDSCQTVDRDEDGAGGIEQWPCEGSPNCSEMLCEDCRAICDICGLSSCAEHLKLQEGEKVCEICAAEENSEDICIGADPLEAA